MSPQRDNGMQEEEVPEQAMGWPLKVTTFHSVTHPNWLQALSQNAGDSAICIRRERSANCNAGTEEI
jgi:hypothetical protein